MTKHRSASPRRPDRRFFTDGGRRTRLVSLDGIELPLFLQEPLQEPLDDGDCPHHRDGHGRPIKRR